MLLFVTNRYHLYILGELSKLHTPFQHQVYLSCLNFLNPSSIGCAARRVTRLEAEEKIMQVSEIPKNSFSL